MRPFHLKFSSLPVSISGGNSIIDALKFCFGLILTHCAGEAPSLGLDIEIEIKELSSCLYNKQMWNHKYINK